MELKGKRATLIGLGRSSTAAAGLLQHHGAFPFITEIGNSAGLREWQRQCDDGAIPYEIGGHSKGAFEDADMIILSPGVPLTAPCLETPRRRGVPVLGELEFAWEFCSGRMLAVTGTNGKTTVTSLLHAMIAACGFNVALAGNNDTPLSQVALQTPQPDYVVLEVSSYQLESMERFRPCVAAVLNVTPDHLSRHGDMERYVAAKARIFAQQQAGDAAVLNADDPLVLTMPIPPGVHRYYFSLKEKRDDGFYADQDVLFYGDEAVAALADNPLPGRHNLANVLAALAMMRAMNFSWQGTLAGLRGFKSVEHRIEHVMDLQGVKFYNDSKSTNIDSLRVALESFHEPIVLIAGGRGKGSDYRSLRELIRERVRCIIVIGEDAPLIAAAFNDLAPIRHADSMMDAVRQAHQAACAGDVALLSPACASFDRYANFEARGRDFKECVVTLAQSISHCKEKCS